MVSILDMRKIITGPHALRLQDCCKICTHCYLCYWYVVGRDSSVGIATRHGLEGSWIESRWGRDFPHSSRLGLGPTERYIQWVADLISGGKAAGAWC